MLLLWWERHQMKFFSRKLICITMLISIISHIIKFGKWEKVFLLCCWVYKIETSSRIAHVTHTEFSHRKKITENVANLINSGPLDHNAQRHLDRTTTKWRSSITSRSPITVSLILSGTVWSMLMVFRFPKGLATTSPSSLRPGKSHKRTIIRVGGSDIQSLARPKAQTPQCSSLEGCSSRSSTCWQAETYCPMPNHQVQPPCTSWTWFHPDRVEGRIFRDHKTYGIGF